MSERINRIINNLLVKEKGRLVPYTLEERMKYFHTTAFGFAVIDDYEIAEVFSTGVRVYGEESYIDNNTPFMAASVSKAVFAVAVMKLVQKGILDLDRDVNDYLIGYEVPSEEGLSNKITLRQILGHLAGLNVSGFGGYSLDSEIPTLLQVLKGEPPAKTEAVKVIRPQNVYVPKTLENPTGPYSGGGYCIAQKVVCDVTGRPFTEIMDDLVLKPFDMKNSTFIQAKEEDFSRKFKQKPPLGYNPTRQGLRLNDYVPVKGGYHVYTEMAAGGLWSTSEDLAKFGTGLMNILRDDNDSALSQENLEKMLIKQENSDNGIGFYIDPTENPEVKMFGHTGCNDGFLSLAYYFTNGQGITMMFNSNEGLSLYLELSRAVSREFGFPISPENIDFKEEEKMLMKGEE